MLECENDLQFQGKVTIDEMKIKGSNSNAYFLPLCDKSQSDYLRNVLSQTESCKIKESTAEASDNNNLFNL